MFMPTILHASGGNDARRCMLHNHIHGWDTSRPDDGPRIARTRWQVTLKLYDTMSERKVEFAPQDGNTVRMYVCGVTPYDTTHIGHAMTYLTFDVLNRYCQYLGWRVKYVQNVTDIDDDIL